MRWIAVSRRRGPPLILSSAVQNTMQTIIVADDQELYQAGMVELLSGNRELHVKTQFSSWKSLLGALAVNRGALVIASTSYVHDVKSLVLEANGTRCRVLLLTEDSDSPFRYRSTGVAGVIQRSASPAALMDTIRKTMPSNNSRLVNIGQYGGDDVGARAASSLNPGEMTVVAMMMQGYKNRRIGENLGITEQAVRSRFQKIFDKTGLSTRLELALFISHHPTFASTAADVFARMESSHARTRMATHSAGASMQCVVQD